MPSKKTVAAFAAVGLLGIAVGSGTASSEPAVVTKTERVVDGHAVAACQDALDKADTLIDYGYQALTITGDAMESASQFDAYGIDAAARRLEAITPGTQAARAAYDSAAANCRGVAS